MAQQLNWKFKAFIQNIFAALPRPIADKLYFQMQRYFATLKKPWNPFNHFLEGVEMLKSIKRYGGDIVGKTFFEVGTGWIPALPIIFWLAGARKIITVDLNTLMRNELIIDIMFFVQTETEKIKNIFGDLLNDDRFEQLLDYSKTEKINKTDFLNLCQIEYKAPCDASKTNLPDNSIDYHMSHNVYEHIPMDILYNILLEGNRIIANNGLFVNHIDYADHFSYMDKNISAINFLQYNEKDYMKYAGNKFMYMNRARHNEFVDLFENVEHNFLEITPYKDENIAKMLENNQIILDEKYRNIDKKILSITKSIFITNKKL
jgi:hypothetical protein